ncbi:hypothetical protein Tco_0644211 [Tanacetum coccineum]
MNYHVLQEDSKEWDDQREVREVMEYLIEHQVGVGVIIETSGSSHEPTNKRIGGEEALMVISRNVNQRRIEEVGYGGMKI